MLSEVALLRILVVAVRNWAGEWLDSSVFSFVNIQSVCSHEALGTQITYVGSFPSVTPDVLDEVSMCREAL